MLESPSMEQQQRSLIFTAAVGLIILAIIVGSIYYLVKFIQSRVASNRQAPQASVVSIGSDSPNAEGSNAAGQFQANQTPQSSISRTVPQTAGAINVSGDKKIYNAGNFQLTYPKTWGILNCLNSNHFELDPVNSADSKIICSKAIKPITILVDEIDKCTGNNTKIGNIEIIKSKKVDIDGYTAYQWCTKTDPVLNITHRVSKNGEQATAQNDYSSQIEDMISKLTFAHGS